MWSFSAFCDEFYVNSRLFLKLELDPSRESLLHFFEQIRRAYPGMARLRRRDDGGLLLDEEEAGGRGRRFVRVDPSALKFGNFNPPDREAVEKFARSILVPAPVQLSLSDLDYDYLEVVYGFDLEYRGNHDELVADTLFADYPLLRALTADEENVIDCQPFLGFALSEDCDRQVYVEVKGRTSTFEVRTGEFETAPLSVYVTVRQYWGFRGDRDLQQVHKELLAVGEQYAAERVVPYVVQPLAAAIASGR